MSGEQDFWSRRKARVQAEERAQQAAVEEHAVAEAQKALEDKPDAEILQDLGLPDPDTLKMGDDFSAFMSKAVPDRIRRRALRTLWRSNPVLANVDMLVDYGEDFTDSAMVVENLQTAYQVGKGMLKHVQEMERQALAEADADSPEEDPQGTDEVLADADEVQPEPVESAAPEAEAEVETATQETEEHAPAPPSLRRMKFRTEEAA